MDATPILNTYIGMMTGRAPDIAVRIDPDAFGVPLPAQDDAYTARVCRGAGEIRATNPRAARIAAYHLLRACGCGFTRPGAGGEVIPSGLPLEAITAQIEVRNAHRFRGICIEGAVSLESALDLLEWMPKVGLNTYFMQFREGYAFFDRHYGEKHRRGWMPLDFNLEVSRDINKRIVSRAKELGLLYHGVGHGFHVECFGIPGLGWDPAPGAWPEEYAFAMAERGGKRAMHWDIPMITALCYENETVRETMAEKAAEYIAARPEYDYAHFWLDDGFENKCECPLCRDTLISDSYMRLLNRLDARLTALGCATKIVFLAYCETLWPPAKEALANPERFTFMFAPISRDSQAPLWSHSAKGEMRPYALNQQPFPKERGQLMAHLDAWNAYRRRNGMDLADGFDFDYYGVKHNDPGQGLMAGVVHDDVIHLRGRGLNGVVNCQPQRMFADAALPMYVYAAALLQPERGYDDIADAFFREAFSAANGPAFRKYFERLTEASACLRAGEGGPVDEAAFGELENALEEPLPDYRSDDIGVAESVRLLRFTRALYRHLLAVSRARRTGSEDALQAAVEAAGDFALRHAPQFENAFDPHTFLEILKKSKVVTRMTG